MKTPDDDQLDVLLRDAARDARPLEWACDAARGLEVRVLKRIARPESWMEAIFSLSSWRPLAAAVFAVLVIGVWSGREAVDVLDDDWLTTQTAGDTDSGAEFDDFEF